MTGTRAENSDVLSSYRSGLTLEELEQQYILRTLREYKGNRTKTAEALGIGRNTLIRKLKRFGTNE